MAFRDWFLDGGNTPQVSLGSLTPVRHRAPDPVDAMISMQPTAPLPQETHADVYQKPDLSIFGATGTPIISGFVTDLQEYNPKLRGRYALPQYEEMRRSDADVGAAWLVIKLPIKGSEFRITPGVNDNHPGYEQAKEEAQFIEDNLFGGLEYENSRGDKITQPWSDVIDNAMLCFLFGCSGSEDIWTIDEDKVRLARIAPRLPLTFYRFIVDPDGETLDAVEQWGYRGDQWVTVQVPANKFTLYSFQKEGANFYGTSGMRPVYQPWFVKQALYRFEGIASERNGVGIPTMTGGPSASIQDKQAAQTLLQNLSIHELQNIYMPNGFTFELAGVKGNTHDTMKFIEHMSQQISKGVLATFLSMGTQGHGNRALGDTMVDFFEIAERSFANFLCQTTQQTTIRRLIDFNFTRKPGKPLPYPKLEVPSISVLNPLDMLSALKDIAASGVDLIQPDDETENFLRKEIGLPKKSGQVRPRYGPVVIRDTSTPAATDTPLDIESGKPISGPPAGPATPAPKKPAPQLKPAGRHNLSPFAKHHLPQDAPVEKLSEHSGHAHTTMCDWVTINGQAICIGDSGSIEKGPAALIGKDVHSARAKLSYVPATKAMQDKGDEWGQKIRDTVGGKLTTNNSPADIVKGNHAIEVKTIQSSKKDRVEMRPDSRAKKEAFVKENGMKGHTVAIDLRGGKQTIYYHEGFGAFRFGSMEKVSLTALKAKLK